MYFPTNPGLWLQAAILYGKLHRVASHPDPVITPAAQLAERNFDVIGYFSTNSSYAPLPCTGSEITSQSDYYVGCINQTATQEPMVTTCEDSRTYQACGATETCDTLTVLPSKGASTTFTWVGCLNVEIPGRTLYQTEPPPPSPPSQAWIAGPVIGSIVGAVSVGVLVWYIMRRKKRRAEKSAAPNETVATTSDKQPGSPTAQSGLYSPTHSYFTTPAQAPSPSPIQWQPPAQEMPGQQWTNPLAELSTTPSMEPFPATGGWRK